MAVALQQRLCQIEQSADIINGFEMRSIALVILFLGAFYFLGARDYGGGVDGGTHYAIAEFLSQHLVWPFPKTSPLGWISYYPPAAHVLAVGLGLIVGSTLHGLFIVTAISFVLFYLVVADLLKGTSEGRTLSPLIFFVVLTIAVRKFRFVVGNEILENFFFAQFVGNAALMAGFYFAYQNVLRPWWVWLAICAVAVHLVGWIYPLSAINLAIAMAVLRFAPMVDFRHKIIHRALESAISAVVLCAAAIVHPTMLDMVGISNNNGGISITDATIVWIVLGSLILSLVLLWAFMGTESVRTGALFALSAGALAPCLALVGLNMLGVGSLYAAKKSGFLLGTVGLMMAAVLMSKVSSHTKILSYPKWPNIMDGKFVFNMSRSQASVISCLFVGVVMLCVFAGWHNEPVGRLTSFDRDVRRLLSKGAPDNLNGVTILMDSAVAPHVNFLIGNAVLRQTLATQAQHDLFSTNKPKLDGVKFAIVDVSDPNRYEPACVIQSSGRLAVVTSECLVAKLK